MDEKDLGYSSEPEDSYGIRRHKTPLGQLRAWVFPRSDIALKAVTDEIGSSSIPGLYILAVKECSESTKPRKVYIGESESVSSRLAKHISDPEPKIKNWRCVILFNDGRGAPLSVLTATQVRLALERYLVQLFKVNRYDVVTASTRTSSLSGEQGTLVNLLQTEVYLFLSKMGLITRPIGGAVDQEVTLEEVKKILLEKGRKITKWGKQYAWVDGQRIIIRPGSKKPAGWQVTFRGNTLDQLKKGIGFLLMPRGKVVFLPLQVIRSLIDETNPAALTKDTVDIFVRFEENRILLVYKKKQLDITSHTLRKK